MMFVSSNSNTTAVTEFTPGFQWDRVRARIYILYKSLVRVIVFNATFNNISVILWQSVLLLEEIGENHRKQDSSAPRHFGTVEKKCQIGTAFSFKYKLGKSYIELFIFILIFFGASSE